MAQESAGSRILFNQMLKPLEALVTSPYEALPDSDFRHLLHTLTHLRSDILHATGESLPFWDAYLALAYHAVYLHRLHIAEKNDRALENLVYGAAKIVMDYCVNRLEKPVGSSFLTMADCLKLLASVYNLGSPYGKNEIMAVYKQLETAKVPPEVDKGKSDTEHEEEKKDTKRNVHTVPPVPVVNVKNLITPIIQSGYEPISDLGISLKPSGKFSERYGKKMYWYLCENHIGDTLLNILKNSAVFSTCMDTDITAINFFKAVITKLADARQIVGKVDIVSLELDAAYQMSKIPLPDCCSPENLELVCGFGISCIANACKLLTALNVIDCQSAEEEGTQRVTDSRLSTMKKAEQLLTVYEQLEKSIAVNNREAARNMVTVCCRYLLTSLEGMLIGAADTDSQSIPPNLMVFSMPGLYLVRHLLTFLGKLTDDLRSFEIPLLESLPVTVPNQLVLSEIYTPWYRLVYVMRQHDTFGVIIRALVICQGQAFHRLVYCVKNGQKQTSSPSSGVRDAKRSRSRDSDDSSPRPTKLSVSQDDLILGCLWEELSAEPISDGSGSTATVQDTSLTESLLDTVSKIVHFVDREFLQSEHGMMEIILKEFFAARHLSLLLPIMTGNSFEYVPSGEMDPPHLRVLVGKCELALDLFFHNLVTTGFVSDEHILTVLKSIGLDLSPSKKNDPWPLYIPRGFLSFFGRVLLKWQFDQQDDTHESPRHAPISSTATLTIWSRVCVALQHRALGSPDTVQIPSWWKSRMEFEDLNPEHLYLLLLAFHGLALMQKKSVLTQLAAAFVSCTCKIKEWSEKSLLIVARILVTVEYLMHRLYEPADSLMRQVEGLLFPAAAQAKGGDTQIPAYELAQKVCEMSSVDQTRYADLYRVFYYVIIPESTHQDPLTLDGLACSFLLAPNKFPEHADFYQALNTLWNQLHGKTVQESDSLRNVATFNYAALLIWRLLRVLPPSLAHWDMLRKDGQEFALDSVQNVTAALWTARLTSKSYKTWLKDTFVKLGLTPLNADLMLSNCADTVGLNKDLHRLRIFMESFLNSQREQKRKLEVPRAPEMPAIDASPSEETARSELADTGLRTWLYDGPMIDDRDFPKIPLSLSLVCLVSKVQQAMEEIIRDTNLDRSRLNNAATTFVPLLLDCIVQYGHFCASSLMNRIAERITSGGNTLEVYRQLLFVCGQNNGTVLASTNHVLEAVPPLLTDVLIEWQMKEAGNQPMFPSHKDYQHNEAMTFDGFINSAITNHMTGTTNIKVGNASGRNLSLKYTLNILVQFLHELVPWLPVSVDNALKEQFRKALMPVVMGCFVSEDAEVASGMLEKILGDNTFQVQYMKTLMYLVYDILKLLRDDSVSTDMDPTGIASKCVETFNALLDTQAGRTAMAAIFQEKSFDITEIMLSISKSQFSSAYDVMVLNFVNRILVETAKTSDDATLALLSQSLRKIEQRSPEVMQMWMDKVLRNPSWKDGNERKCVTFLENWVAFIQVADRSLSEMLAEVLLKALTAIVSPNMGVSGSDYPLFADLMPIMEVLAASCKTGHELLLTSSVTWLKSCIQYLSQREVKDKLDEGVTGGTLDQVINAIGGLLLYVGRILSALRHDTKRTASPDPDDLDVESSLIDENDEDEESAHGEESSDEVDDSKLCTFTITAREFMSQHWYHCHTCGLTNGQGMCSVCAKVCHRGHDVTYSKFGSFFCDCGAKDDGSCQALRKRNALAVEESSSILIGSRAVGAFSSTSLGAAKGADASNGAFHRSKEMDELNHQLQEQLNSQREALTRLLNGLDISSVLISLMGHLVSGANGVVRALCSSAGRSEKVAQRLKTLQNVTLPPGGKAVVELNDRLLQTLVATQEGTFETIKSSVEAPDITTARTMLHQNAVRRRVMAVFSHGPAKYLAMAVEKTKISVYQLSHLLKQVCDRHQLPLNGNGSGSATKLMLPCHGNIVFPFNVWGIVVNPLREGLIAVAGNKDCVAVLMNPELSTHEQITVNLGSLDSGNFIVKVLWMPDSQTELLVATQDSVKIFDLSKNTERPVYDLLIANGKIRDVTVAFLGRDPHVLIMSSTGQVFVQELNAQTTADMGPFFVTTTLNLANSELPRETSRDEDDATKGGVAVYYSHALQLLFLSYEQGKLFAAPLTSISCDNTIIPVTELVLSKQKVDNIQGKSLWCFSESGGFPGQLFAWLQGISTPMVIVIDSDTLAFHTVNINIKTTSKIKALDMVVTKYTSADGPHTILATVNDDGTLKFYSLQSDSTTWMPTDATAVARSKCRVSIPKSKESSSSNPSFPVDFFENCTVLSNIEFGGDLVDVYSKGKLKSRLEQNATYIVSERTQGFNLEVTNLDHSYAFCGFRVGLGAQGLDKYPTSVKVFGRSKPFILQRARHFDFPLTEEESVLADRKLSIHFSPAETGGMTYLDSIVVYGKAKSTLGWDKEGDQTQLTEPPSKLLTTKCAVVSLIDTVLGRTLKALELAISIWPLDTAELRNNIMDKTINLISTCQALPQVYHNAKCLLFPVHDFQRSQFHSAKDVAVIGHCLKMLEELVGQMKNGNTTTHNPVDSSSFFHLLVSLRPIAAKRPANLYQQLIDMVDETKLEMSRPVKEQPLRKTLRSESRQSTIKASSFLESLASLFWQIHGSLPKKVTVANVVQLQELLPIEHTVQFLIEIIHVVMAADAEMIPVGVKLYVSFIGCKDQMVALAAKNAILRTLRPREVSAKVVVKEIQRQSRERNEEPVSAPLIPDLEEGGDSDENEADESFPVQEPVGADVDVGQNMEEMLGELQMVWQMVEPHLGAGQGLDDFIENPNNLQQILDIPPDADDEAMLDLAMALNMQPEDVGHENASSIGVASIQPQVGEESTDSNTDAEGASDDEASNAPTETSALRPQSPNDAPGSTHGSDEGSGGSSLAGDTSGPNNQTLDIPGSENVSTSTSQTDLSSPAFSEVAVRKLKRAVIERLQGIVGSLTDGLAAVPTMQLLFNLCVDLDPGRFEEDQVLLDKVIYSVVAALRFDREDKASFAVRTPENEVVVLLLRFLSVLISKSASRYRKYKSNVPIPASFTNHCASILNGTRVLDLCHYVLKLLSDKNKVESEAEKRKKAADMKLLKPKAVNMPPDMAPFFLKPFVKSCGHDLFQDYTTLLTEMALRLPYQMKKVSDAERLSPPPNFDQSWCFTLCDYMSFGAAHIDRRPPRKLLMLLCGSKDKYRQVRDLYAFDHHIREVKKLCGFRGGLMLEKTLTDLDYDSQTTVAEHLKTCLEIALARTSNWQRHCQKERSTLVFLIRLAVSLDEPVATTILQLLLGLFGVKDKTPALAQIEEGPVVKAVVTLLNQSLDVALLKRFIRCFLLQANSAAMRMLSHHFLYAYYRNSDAKYQDSLIGSMWKLFEELPTYGHKVTEFVDLLGYLTVKNPFLGEADWRSIVVTVIDMLKSQNQVMNRHPNARIYQQLGEITGLEGYYLESDPCLVCNCPDAPMQMVKLSSIKADAKYTSTSQLYKLTGAFVIDKIVLKITELKRAKMVKGINVYYSNVAVDNIVELKNNMAAWKKAKGIQVAHAQAEVKVEFMLPIQATNVMIEYAEFYDNPGMTQETLQCPRCSTMVPAHPGICGNCGENVFQCLKCRSINYENREPFLCHSCGFCKYGKFEYTVNCRPSSSGNLDPVINEEQRRRTIGIVDQLLTKCDSQYRTLQVHRNSIENMLLALQKSERDGTAGSKPDAPGLALPSAGLSNAANVNPTIQAVAYRYSVECKNTVQTMVQHIQKIMACRKLLKAYDRRLMRTTSVEFSPKPTVLGDQEKARSGCGCYGCATAASQFCIRILRVIARVKNQHYFSAYPGLMNELIENHLHRGNHEQRMEVKQLINSLMQGSQSSAVELITLLQERIGGVQKFCTLSPSIAASIGNEISILEMDGGEMETDKHWELKLRCVVRLFLDAVQSSVAGVLECVALPCLRIILSALKDELKGQNVEALSTLQLPHINSIVRVMRWLKGDARNSFQAWASRCPKKLPPGSNVREVYLSQKYGLRWRERARNAAESDRLILAENSWLKRLVFYPGSQQLRALAVELLQFFLACPSRSYFVYRFIGSLLNDLGEAGEYAAELIHVIKTETEGNNPSIFVACRGILERVTVLISTEISRLTELEATAVNSSLAQGYALKYLTSILGNLLRRDDIRTKNRSTLIGPIFNGYLALRKLTIQRTKQVNEAEEKLLEIMESMTSGTEDETRSFMVICIEALKHCESGDYRTPQFIYERLCTIIFPQEKEKTEFSLVIEKDPQQEDFLQGRMQGNPYPLSAFASRGEPGGTERDVTMRDIKNKVCRDCELVALLDDDTAMELLVAGKIISLDLPVKSVYKRLWLKDNPEGSPMRVMYRLRGLMGDATEEFIEDLGNRNQNNADPEEVYRLASILSEGDGFPTVIGHLSELSSPAVADQAGPLIDVILKVLSYAINLKINRQALISHAGDWKVFSTFIALLKTTIRTRQNLAHPLVSIMQTVLKEGSATLSADSYREFVMTCGTKADVHDLLEILDTLEADAKAAEQLLRIVPFLCFCHDGKMGLLVEHFQPALEFGKVDGETVGGVEVRNVEWLVRMIEMLEGDEVAGSLKELWIRSGMTKRVVDYFLSHGSVMASGSAESPEFKKCVNKNSMKYVLRLLTGLARGHEATQVLLSRDCVPSIHRLEHVSTPLSVLAENLMEVMKENKAVRERIEQIRDQTKAEKKRLAMAMRARQLGAMGMKANDKGEIVITKPAVKGLEELSDDTGLHCCICREGYRFKPDKVLGVYTFTRRQNVEELEQKSPKTVGSVTVTHFTCVHVECHSAAIKSTREEWEKASWHNANTKCNGILPMWGPDVPESAYAQALAKFNQHMQDYTGVREANYTLTIHDLKLALLLFAEERSFSEYSKGGGRDSNMRLIPYTLHTALYVMTRERAVQKERTAMQNFLKARPSNWRATCHVADSPVYYAVLYMLLYERKQWIQDRLTILQRMLVYCHEKRGIVSNEPQEYSVYKSGLVLFGLIDLVYAKMLAQVPSEGEWTETLATFVRNGDVVLMEGCEGVLRVYEEELLPATSVAEVMDILHLLDVVTDPHAFIVSAFAPQEAT